MPPPLAGGGQGVGEFAMFDAMAASPTPRSPPVKGGEVILYATALVHFGQIVG